MEKLLKAEEKEWERLRDMSTDLPIPGGLQKVDARKRNQWVQGHVYNEAYCLKLWSRNQSHRKEVERG
jgi:hypothetical protein